MRNQEYILFLKHYIRICVHSSIYMYVCVYICIYLYECMYLHWYIRLCMCLCKDTLSLFHQHTGHSLSLSLSIVMLTNCTELGRCRTSSVKTYADALQPSTECTMMHVLHQISYQAPSHRPRIHAASQDFEEAAESEWTMTPLKKISLFCKCIILLSSFSRAQHNIQATRHPLCEGLSNTVGCLLI